MEIIAQILSIIGMIGTVLAFQIKSKSRFCFASMCTCALFATSYALFGICGMPGAFTSAGVNLICAGRGALATSLNTRTKPFFAVVCVLLIGVSVFTYDGIMSIFICFAELLSTFTMWFTSEIMIRRVRYAIISPIWLVNNLRIGSIGAVICEIFSIISAIIFCIRMRKNKKA